jgi:hypothetical protein
MVLSRSVVWLSLSAAIPGFSPVRAQQDLQYLVDHSDCKYFGADHEKFARTGLNDRRFSAPVQRYRPSMRRRPSRRPAGPGGSVARRGRRHSRSTNTIDKYLFAAMKDAGVTPAPTTDFEFIRRVTLT